MSLSGSLSNALSGLTAASRAAEIVSSNVANAMTPGYQKRELVLSSNAVDGAGAGVQVDGVLRLVDERLVSDRRIAQAGLANATTEAAAWSQIETAIGLPTESGSIASKISAFDAALINATSRPDQTVRLDAAVEAASDLAIHIRSASSEVQQIRMNADADIASMVEQLNSDLEQIQTLNWQIFKMGNSGQDVSGLLDQRQALVDSIAEAIPVRQVARDGGQIALFTTGGTILLDGQAAEIGFTATRTITPDMTYDAGSLSGLTLNGIPLDIGGTYDPIAGGKLAAAFDIRDGIGVEAQTELDALARDLIERFQDPALDATLAVGDAGLFTDGNGAFDTSDEIGLAARIGINSAVDPDAGGESWRLRDGLEAAASGDVGNSALLSALTDRLNESRATASGASAGLQRSTSELASDVLSQISRQQQSAETRQGFEAAQLDAISTEEARNGVDTDDEMQKLLLIEQSYAANARVIQTIEELLDQLLGI
ncbi:flagellar hook-associated protein FlgK [Tropicimonas aquimaris]|uniref:Flagellar hook-associated protein 1 n=1 Tax=Tropicimonas aquimaris TaxID=914152 RepID=A0ABW3IVU0_9RHOB